MNTKIKFSKFELIALTIERNRAGGKLVPLLPCEWTKHRFCGKRFLSKLESKGLVKATELSARANGFLRSIGIYDQNKEKVSRMIVCEIIKPNRKPRLSHYGYGEKTHLELCEWCGLKKQETHPSVNPP